MAEATLNDVTAMLQMQNEEQGKTTSAVVALVQRVQGLIDIQKRSILDEAEAERERGRNGGKEPPSATGGLGDAKSPFAIGDALLAGAALSLAALGTFFNQEIEEVVQQIRDAFLKFIVDLQKIAFSINNLLVKPISVKLLALIDSFKAGPIGKAIDAFFDVFRGTFRFISGALGRAVTLVSGGMTALLPSFEFLKGIGKIFSRLFLPLTIFITAWDTVKGAVDGFKEDGIIGGIEGAVVGFFNSLIFAPLDLIKKATEWLFDQVGLTSVADAIGDFSFQETFAKLVEGIFEDVKKIGSFVGDLFKGEFSLEKAQEALGAIFSLSPVGMIMNLVEGIVPGIFEKVGNALDFFVEQLKIGSQEALLKVMNLIQNIPDQLVAFLSDNLRISIPKIAIPIPGFLGGGELVIAEPSEIGVPGGESARARIAERNARLEAQLLELNRQNLQNVQGVGAGSTTVINQNSTVSNAQSTTIASDIPAAQDIYMNKGLLGGGGGF